MTKRNIVLEIDCGDTTCASSPGKFCPGLASRNFGSRFYCTKFSVPGTVDDVELFDDGTGWLQRCQACLDTEQRGEKV